MIKGIAGWLVLFVVSGCVAGIGGESDDEGALEDETIAIAARARNSLVVTQPRVLDRLGRTYDMGELLGEVGKMENALTSRSRTVGQWVARIFELAQNQQDDYRVFAQAKGPALGPPAKGDRSIQRVLEQWTDRDCNKIHRNSNGSIDQSFSAIKDIDRPAKLRSKSFRLLSVVNRIDLAGEFDDRLTNEVSQVPRFLGEVHLVYGLIDRTKKYEDTRCRDGDDKKGKRAYPMTFVLTYRIPVIKARGVPLDDTMAGEYMVDRGTPMFALGKDDALWRERMSMWAGIWSSLGDAGTTGQLTKEVDRILALVARPENFLSLRTNTEVAANEFELREWYVFGSGSFRDPANASGLLIPRRIRREPYACLNQSAAITKQVNHYWQASAGDLDMSTRHYNLNNDGFPGSDSGRSFVFDQDRGGYGIMRDTKRPLLSELDAFREGPRNYYWTQACGTKPSDLAFGMLTGPNRNDAPTLNKARDTLMMLTPFARANASTLWKLDAESMAGDSAQTKEAKRHAFALRTCSGCHSQEGGVNGFHISPRLAGEASELSSFMTGGATFDHAGQSYTYDVLRDRRKALSGFATGEQELFEALKVPE